MQFRKNAKDMVDWICDYYASNEKLPVRSEVEPGYLRPRLPQTAPQHPENFNSIMQDVHAHIMPGEHQQPCTLPRRREGELRQTSLRKFIAHARSEHST